MTYQEWTKAIDAILLRTVGITSTDLRDRPTSLRDLFNAGDTPREALEAIGGDPEADPEAFMMSEFFGD